MEKCPEENIALALRYEFGRGVGKDVNEARRLFLLAAEAGSAFAEFRLGRLYFSNGRATPADLARAYSWFLASAEKGYANAQYMVGICCVNGKGIERDLATAVHWLRMAAEANHVEACSVLANLFQKGYEGIPCDLQECIQLRERAKKSHVIVPSFGLLSPRWCRLISSSRVLDYRIAVAKTALAKQLHSNKLGAVGEIIPLLKAAVTAADYPLAKYHLAMVQLFGEGKEAIKNMNMKNEISKRKEAGKVKPPPPLLIDDNDEDSFLLVSEAAEAGITDAQYLLGAWLLNRYHYGGTSDPAYQTRAMELLNLAANNGDTNALRCLAGISFAEGQNKEGLKLLRKAVDLGCPLALENLAYRYYEGDGVPADFAKAAPLYQRLAKLGDLEGITRLGVMTLRGYGGIPRNDVEAVRMFRRAADEGFGPGLLQLGLCYFNGVESVPQDTTEALRLIRLAADKGFKEAEHQMGIFLLEGKYVAKNPAKAVRYFTKAVRQGHRASQYELGKCYRDGTGVAKNPVEAAGFFAEAALEGCYASLGQLGICMMNGFGVERDFGRGLLTLKKAAELGDADSEFELGKMYFEGHAGVPRNVKLGLKYCCSAAEKGQVDAVTMLAEWHYNVEEGNKKEAATLFTYGATLGRAHCQMRLATIYFTGVGVDKDVVQGKYWSEQAADPDKGNDKEAQFGLGVIYYQGRYLPQDLEAAKRYFALAAGQGHVMAQQMLENLFRRRSALLPSYKMALLISSYRDREDGWL